MLSTSSPATGPELNIGLLGLEGRAAREPSKAINQASRIVAHLRTSDLSKEPVLIDDLRPEPESYADALAKAVGRARQAGTDLDAGQRAVERAVLGKKEAMTTYQRVFLRTARIFEDLCRLAGKDELADRVRPSQSRPGTLESLPPAGEPSTASPSADAPSADAPAADAPPADAPSAAPAATDAPSADAPMPRSLAQSRPGRSSRTPPDVGSSPRRKPLLLRGQRPQSPATSVRNSIR